MLLACKYIDYTGNTQYTKYNKQYTQSCHYLISLPSKIYAQKKKITIAEIFEKCSILFKCKAGENFNHRNTLSILRIALKLHFVQNVEPNAEIGQKGAFCKGLAATPLTKIKALNSSGFTIWATTTTPNMIFAMS
jgi:hypothetical protein